MKKIIIAAIAFTMLVACGGNGNEKKSNVEDKTAERQEKQSNVEDKTAECQEKQLSVEDQAVEYYENLLKAVEAGDYEKVGELEAEMDKWYESLSEADQKKAAEAWIQWGAERARKDVEELEKAFENL